MRTRARLYRLLLWLYPPKFRRDYGESMLQLYIDRRRSGRDSGPSFRIVRDLAVSVPYEYWESFMDTSHVARATITVVFTGAAVIAAIVLGSTVIGLLLILLFAWQLYAILKMRGRSLAPTRWWQFVAGGFGVFAAIFIVFALPWPESWRSQVPGDLAFYVVMGGIASSIVLVALGVVSGIAQLTAGRRGSRAA